MPSSNENVGRRPTSATIAVKAGRREEPGASLTEPAVFASAYRAGRGHGYAREGNPTWSSFETAVAQLEGGGEAVAFASGMAAAAAIVATLPPGAVVVAASTSHVEVRDMLEEQSDRGALELRIADPADDRAFAASMRGADLVWVDSISNPSLEIADIDTIVANACGARVLVDSTLATPVLQRPLDLGAGVVLHSASKYLGGHSDLLLGVVATRDPDLAGALRAARSRFGSTPGTMETWLALRGIRTLALRVERGQESARFLADNLRRAGAGVVHYPGIGAMLSLDVGDAGVADAICRNVELIVHAGSLGGVETLIERHAHWHSEASIPPGLLRLSIGIEDAADLWADLERSLTISRLPARRESAAAS